MFFGLVESRSKREKRLRLKEYDRAEEAKKELAKLKGEPYFSFRYEDDDR